MFWRQKIILLLLVLPSPSSLTRTTHLSSLITHPSPVLPHLSHPSPLLHIPHLSSLLPPPSSLTPSPFSLISHPSSLIPRPSWPHSSHHIPHPSPSSRIVTEKITPDKFCKIMEKKKIIRIRIKTFWIRHTGSNPAKCTWLLSCPMLSFHGYLYFYIYLQSQIFWKLVG